MVNDPAGGAAGNLQPTRPVGDRYIAAFAALTSLIAILVFLAVLLKLISPSSDVERNSLKFLLAFCMSFALYAFHPLGNTAEGNLKGFLVRLAGPIVLFFAVLFLTDQFWLERRTSTYFLEYGNSEKPGNQALKVEIPQNVGEVHKIVDSNGDVTGIFILFSNEEFSANVNLLWDIGGGETLKATVDCEAGEIVDKKVDFEWEGKNG